MLGAALLTTSCADDNEQTPQEVDYCIRAAWQNGLGDAKLKSSLTATNILTDAPDDIVIEHTDYPATIDMTCKKGDVTIKEFTLSKGTSLCTEHNEYWRYTPSFIFRDQLIRRENYTFYASATIDDGDELEGTATKENIDGNHMLLTLHHKKALLRFAFKVSEKYSKVRYIRVKSISLNGANCTLVDKVLTTSNQLIAYAYVDPAVVTTSKENTLACTYYIYDKDAATDEHITRKDVTAQNTFTLGTLKDASSNPVTTIRAGYYYDLKVTLNPDYLYVLAEHDNKHITIE